jgi:hypothetical protein
MVVPVLPLHVMKAYKETWTVDGGGGGVNFMSRPLYPPEKIPGYTLVRRMLDRHPEPVWTVLEERTSLARFSDHPAHSHYAISAPEMSTRQGRYHFTGVSFTSCTDTYKLVNRSL